MQISIAANVLGNPALDILVISIVVASLAAWQSVCGRPYTSVIISILEMSFIVNLLYLAVTTYYANLTGTNSAIFSYISTGLALTTFIGIVVFHIYKCMRKTPLIWIKCQRTETDNNTPSKVTLFSTMCQKTENDDDVSDTNLILAIDQRHGPDRG